LQYDIEKAAQEFPLPVALIQEVIDFYTDMEHWP
jgi:hypothetical protein